MNETHPNAKEPCYDCGSTIPGHHSDLCDLTGPGDKKDLESCGNRRPGCPQAWIGTLDSNGSVKDSLHAPADVPPLNEAEIADLRRSAEYCRDTLDQSYYEAPLKVETLLALISAAEALARITEERDATLKLWAVSREEASRHVANSDSLYRQAAAERDEARARLLTAAGDDLCRLSQEEIKAMSAGAVKIPPKDEFLASCERFHSQVANEAGVNNNCLTLAQLIAENERLRRQLAER